MKAQADVLISWMLLILFCVFIFLSLEVLPSIWGLLEHADFVNADLIPPIFIGGIQIFLLYYTFFVKKQRAVSSYVWFFILNIILSVIYFAIENPYDKMHLFEYFTLSFLFFRA
ncbi:hypothetical protein ACFL0T_04080, partial [Candidatus Omnitrophota bacterium]